MKSFWRLTGWTILALGLLMVVGVGWLAVNLVDLAVSPDMSITVDGETVHLAGVSGETWLLVLGGAVLAAVVVAMVVLVVLPLALLFGIGLPLLLCVGGVALALLVAGTALLALASPLIALALVAAWALRPRRPRVAPVSSPASAPLPTSATPAA